jgi:hypothetical protein
MLMTASFARRLLSAGIVALVAALVLVPTAARARQHLDRQDTTRLSIKHSWLGVTPPTKASSTAPTPVALVPPPVVRLERSSAVSRASSPPPATPRPVRHHFTDPLRGPPSRLS